MGDVLSTALRRRRPDASTRPVSGPEDARPEVAPGAVLLLLVTGAIVVALVRPWLDPFAAVTPAGPQPTQRCLDRTAETYPVRINVGTYRPPFPGPHGISGQAPGPANNRHVVDDFRYLVTLDDSADPFDPDPASHPAVRPTAGGSPILTEGVASGSTKLLRLPTRCRWLVSVEANVEDGRGGPGSASHQLWGARVDLTDEPGPGYRPRDADGNGDVVEWIGEVPFPIPSGKLLVHVFADTSPTNGKPDDSESAGGTGSALGGFTVLLRDFAGNAVTENARGDPLCSEYDESGRRVRSSGGCRTEQDGTLVIPDLVPGGYEIRATPPDDAAHPWHGAVQTAAFAGDSLGAATVSVQGSGAAGTAQRGVVTPMTEPQTSWFGFAGPKDLPAGPTGRIRACAVHAVSFPPFESRVLDRHEPIGPAWVALSRVDEGQLYARRLGDSATCPGGVIDIQGVPPGTYTMFLWDERLERVTRTIEVTVPPGAAGSGSIVDLPGDDGKGALGLYRRVAWLSGTVFDDGGIAASGATIPGAARNGVRDCLDRRNAGTCEPGLAGEKLELRFRDGSVKSSIITGPGGRYELAAELSELSKFVVATVESGKRSSGPCVYAEALDKRSAGWSHSQYNPLASCLPVKSTVGHGVGAAQLTPAGHRATVDWGLYAPGENGPGRIAGVVHYATTRAEPDPRFARAEDYEPGIAGVPVNLYWTGPNQRWDGGPGAGSDDVLVDRYAEGAGTDAFEHPTLENQGTNGGCDVLDSAGNPVYPAPVTSFGLRVAPSCLELGVTGNETKDGTFDGAFVFEDMCDPAAGGWRDRPAAIGRSGCARRIPLLAGGYVVEVAAAENPDYPAFPYEIVTEDDVNAAPGRGADATAPALPCVGPQHVVRDNRSPFDGQARPLCTHRELTLGGGHWSSEVEFFLFTETPIPGRIFGRVTDGDRVETDPEELRYGNPQAVAGVPVGIRDYAFRLLETVHTDEYGGYEAVLPPARTGYLLVLNDPLGERVATGRVTTSGTSVLGAGTRFTTEIGVGDRIRIGTETRAVTAVAGNGSLRVDRAWPRGRRGPAALYVLSRNPSFDPAYGTETIPVAVLPGKTTLLDTALDRISGAGCENVAGPEFFRVEPANGDGAPVDRDGGVVIAQSLPAASELREVTIRGLGLGVERASPGFPDQAGYVTLVHPDGTEYALDDDSYYGGRGSPDWADEQITFRFPRAIEGSALPGAPYQVVVTTPPRQRAASSEARTAETGITLHYVERGRYDPPRRYVDGNVGTDSPGSGSRGRPYRTIQYAIDRAFAEKEPGRLVIVKPAVYRENPVLYERATLQGYGPGGTIGAGMPSADAEDEVRRSAPGTVVDASFFNYDATIQRRWRAAVNGLPDTAYPGGPLIGLGVETHAGAGITVVGERDTYEVADPELRGAAIDGFQIHSARTDAVFGTGGGGGIVVTGHARGLRLTNNVLAGNQGLAGGGIVVGRPDAGEDGAAGSGNADLRIAFNRILGNGGAYGAGGVAIHEGADGYVIDHNTVCANVSAAAGGGVSHDGRSPGGTIARNTIVFNVAAEGGGGVAVAGRAPAPGRLVGGTGNVTVERNVVAGNRAGEGGGALEVARTVRATATGGAVPDRVTIVNNQVTNNVAAGPGGAIALRDAPNVWIVNDTIAENASTGSCEGCLGGPLRSGGAGGLASRPHSSRLRTLLPAGSAPFSSPVLLNDLFFENASYRFDPRALPAVEGIDALAFVALGDFEVVGRDDLRFRPWYSTLSALYDGGVQAAGATNRVFARARNEDPFRDVFRTELLVGFDASRGRAGVDVDSRGVDARDGGAPGDYHLCDSLQDVGTRAATTCSETAVDTGAASLPPEAFLGTVVPATPTSVPAPSVDIDGDARPVQLRQSSPGVVSGIDIGADEMTTQESAASASRAAAPAPTRVRASPRPTVTPARSAPGAQTGPADADIPTNPAGPGDKPMAEVDAELTPSPGTGSAPGPGRARTSERPDEPALYRAERAAPG